MTAPRRIVALCCAALALALAPGVSAGARSADDAEAVRKLLLEMAAAFERDDRAALERIWAHDEAVLVFENGHANVGWSDYRDNHLGPEMAAMENTKFTLEGIRPRVAGDTAWATLGYSISADVKQRKVERTGLATVVLERREGRWRIVHWHSSNPRRPAGQTAAPKH
jgi:uncharacterized protein (TIGR02246 family)